MKTILTSIILSVLFFCSCSLPEQPTTNINTTNKAKQAIKTESKLDKVTVNSFAKMNENSYGREQLFTEASQSNFNKNQPPKMLDWSLEREQLNDRNLRWNDKNKISYIYLLSDMGTIIAYFSIKGKVSSVNSKLTTNQQVVFQHKGAASSGDDYGIVGTVESPSMDGSYGTNGDAVFFFLTDGTYMEWAGKYLLCDNYIKLNQKPVLTYDIKDVVNK